jgi:hypothetical protein
LINSVWQAQPAAAQPQQHPAQLSLNSKPEANKMKRLLPSFPKHIKPGSPEFGLPKNLVVLINNGLSDVPIVVRPRMRIKGTARILAASRADWMRETVTGADYAALDIFLGHGLLTTPYYYMHNSCGASIQYTYDYDGQGSTKREGIWDGINLPERHGNATHAHMVTAHMSPDQIPDQPAALKGELFDYDFYSVNVFTFTDDTPDGSLRSTLLAAGHEIFGSHMCPFIMPSEALQQLAESEDNCFPASCI